MMFQAAKMRAVPLTKGFVAWVDAQDFERVRAHKWCASIESRGTKVYAVRWVSAGGRRVKLRLHHFVLGVSPAVLPEGFVVHHKDDDGLNCCRDNLEIISQAENMARSEGWKKKGVRAPALVEGPWL